MSKKLCAIRGAVCCENTKEAITEWTCKMMNQLVQENKLKTKDIVSIQFTLTKDLDVLNPATALRKGNFVLDSSVIPLFCSQEAFIQGGMEKVVRVLVTAYGKKSLKKTNVYLNGAQKLRPDCFKK